MDVGGAERGQKPQSNLSETLQLLTLEQRLGMALKKVTETNTDKEEHTKKFEGIVDNYKSLMKEAELRLIEINKAKKQFESCILKTIKGSCLEMQEPEKVLQYIEDKSKVTQLEKFHLKNKALKAQEMKLLQQLQLKEDAQKEEYAVENEIFFQESYECTMDQDLNQLQHNSSKAQRLLRSHKEQLHSLTLESKELSNNITKRQEMIAKLEEEIQHAEKERLNAARLNQHLCKQLADYQAPHITDYFHAKEKHKKLLQSIHHWERKVKIAEMAMKTHSREWRRENLTLTSANSTKAGHQDGKHYISVKFPYIANVSTNKYL